MQTMTDHERKLGFPLGDFEIYDEFDDGFMYYDSRQTCLYTCPSTNAAEWWNQETMEVTITCPYCESSVGGFFQKDAEWAKKWMGKHLALNHSVDVERFLLRQEQMEEYATLTGNR